MANYNAIRYNVPYSDSAAGSLRLIKTLTASSDSTLDFIDGTSDVVLDSTYKEYMFIFNNIHPATDSVYLSFQGNAAGGSGFDETITSSFFRAGHKEDGSDEFLSYDVSNDQGQGTGFQNITRNIGNGNDECGAGYLHLFNPSSTTFVKHFIAKTHIYYSGDYSYKTCIGGYFNTTSAIDEIQFKMSSGDIDAGTIQLFGVL